MSIPEMAKKKKKKKWRKVFGFKENSVCVADNKFSKSRKQYLSSAVNVLRNIPKI